MHCRQPWVSNILCVSEPCHSSYTVGLRHLIAEISLWSFKCTVVGLAEKAHCPGWTRNPLTQGVPQA